MTLAAMTALHAEHGHASGLIASLSPTEWQTMSACAGWRVQDVVQHMASVFHKVASPDTIERGTSWDAEANAEVPVRARRRVDHSAGGRRVLRMVGQGTRSVS